MLRSTSRLISTRANAVPVSQLSISTRRFISGSPINLDGSSKQGMGEKGEASTDAMDATGKDPIEQQVERGRKAGLEKKPEKAGN
ncbi:hypothetical protein JCM3765_006965 [Sporobolomyces pararoseus]